MKNEDLDRLLDVVLLEEKPRATLEERVQLLEDHRALADLVMLYGWLCDRRKWDELLEYYTDDFERTLGGTLEEVATKEDLRELYPRPVLPREVGATAAVDHINSLEIRHMIHPPVVRVSDDGTEATVATVYSMVATTGELPELQRGEHEGIYVFGMRKVPDVGWRFVRMLVVSENGRNPLFTTVA